MSSIWARLRLVRDSGLAGEGGLGDHPSRAARRGSYGYPNGDANGAQGGEQHGVHDATRKKGSSNSAAYPGKAKVNLYRD